MKNHILLEKAYIYPLPKSKPEMDGCSYKEHLGYWVIDKSNTPFIFDQSRPKPQSKKSDQETGEDQKGE